VDIPGRQGRAAQQSPAKFSVGEGGSANQKMLRSVPGMVGVEQSALMHSWQNRATQMAAGRLSRESGEIIPTIGMQAGGWTEARRQAGKNIEEQTPAGRTAAAVKPPPTLFDQDLGASKAALVSPAQLRKGHQAALEANTARGNSSGAQRNREFLSGGQTSLF
jgi:hypothetical protein